MSSSRVKSFKCFRFLLQASRLEIIDFKVVTVARYCELRLSDEINIIIVLIVERKMINFPHEKALWLLMTKSHYATETSGKFRAPVPLPLYS